MPGEMITEGVPLGAIQVTPSGQPIILFVEQQTTGGYPKIANVIGVDLHRVGNFGRALKFALNARRWRWLALCGWSRKDC